MNQLVNLFKLMSDETRLRMLVLLYQEELCVCQLGGILEISQPRISQNLAKLRDLGLVRDERKEKFVFYSLKGDHPMLRKLLSDIMENLAEYPRLMEDQLRLKEKDTYLTTCCVPVR